MKLKNCLILLITELCVCVKKVIIKQTLHLKQRKLISEVEKVFVRIESVPSCRTFELKSISLQVEVFYSN